MQKPKPGYKLVKSLFGKYEEIPEDWKISRLSDLCEKEKDIVAGPFGSNLMVSDYATNGVPIIRLQNIDRNQFIEKNIKFISTEKAKELSYHSYQPGDLVLAKLGDPIGKTCKIPESFPSGIVVADVVRIRTSPKKSARKFVEYILNSWICEKQFEMERIGTTRPRVNLEQIRDLIFPCPTKSEQEKIASILSNVDNLIEKYDFVIETTKKLKTGLMQQLLTKGIGHKKFKKVKWLFGKEIEIPEEWEFHKLKKLSDKIGDGTHSTPNYVNNSGYYFINGNNLNDDAIIFSDRTKNVSEGEYLKYKLDLNENTVLLSINGTIGNIAFYNDEKIILGKSVCYINCNEKLNKKFLAYLLKSDYWTKYLGRELTGTTISNLSLASVRNLLISLPSAEEQNKIVLILSKIDKEINNLKNAKSHFKILKKGLMKELLTGQIRIKV